MKAFNSKILITGLLLATIISTVIPAVSFADEDQNRQSNESRKDTIFCDELNNYAASLATRSFFAKRKESGKFCG
jgi:hypothetical protein